MEKGDCPRQVAMVRMSFWCKNIARNPQPEANSISCPSQAMIASMYFYLYSFYLPRGRL